MDDNKYGVSRITGWLQVLAIYFDDRDLTHVNQAGEKIEKRYVFLTDLHEGIPMMSKKISSIFLTLFLLLFHLATNACDANAKDYKSAQLSMVRDYLSIGSSVPDSGLQAAMNVNVSEDPSQTLLFGDYLLGVLEQLDLGKKIVTGTQTIEYQNYFNKILDDNLSGSNIIKNTGVDVVKNLINGYFKINFPSSSFPVLIDVLGLVSKTFQISVAILNLKELIINQGLNMYVLGMRNGGTDDDLWPWIREDFLTTKLNLSKQELQEIHQYYQVSWALAYYYLNNAYEVLSNLRSVLLNNSMPHAYFTITPNQFMTQHFDARDSTPITNSSIVNYRWNFGDGVIREDETLYMVAHTYGDPGSYIVTLTVEDATGTTDSFQLEVTAKSVIADFLVTSPSPAYPGRTFSFDASSSIAAQADGLQYFWNFGDPGSGNSNTPSGVNVTHEFSTSGTFIVKLAVYDTEGHNDTKEREVKITNPLEVYFTSDYYLGPAPRTVNFTPVSSNELGEGIDSWSWDFGDGTVLEGVGQPTGTFSHEFSEDGSYTVNLTIKGSNCTAFCSKQLIFGKANFPAYIFGGTIYTDTEWSPYFQAYVVQGSLTIAQGAKLTINPGTVVKFQYNSSRLTVNGILSAEGTADSPIIFTSLKDDGYGGDTNNDGSGSSPAAQDWDGIYFMTGSGQSVMKHCVVRYGGYYGSERKEAGIYCDGASPAVTNCTVSHNNQSGIRLNNASPTISNNTISNQSYGIWCEGTSSPTISANTVNDNQTGIYGTNTSSPVITNNTFTSNTSSAVSLSGGTLSTIQNNTATGSPYSGLVISGTITADARLINNPDMPYIFHVVTVVEGVTLTIDPGTVVKSQYNSSRLTVNGILSAEGTADSPIIFTSLKDDGYGGDTNNDGSGSSPAAQDWDGIYFMTGSGQSVMKHCVVRYGGYYGSERKEAGIYCDGASPAVTNCTVSHNNQSGIRLNNASPTISNNTISHHGYYGIYCEGTSSPTINGNTISANSYGIYCYSSYNPTITRNTISANGSYGLYNGDPSIVIIAELNYWGSDSGPTHPSNPEGTGDKVSDNVDFDPWLEFVNDTDADGLPDDWETENFGNFDQTAGGDPDGDGLSNLVEYAISTNPNNPDTDGDGYNDGDEVAAGTDPLDPESFLLMGDVNGNGTLGLEDAILALQVVSGIAPSESVNLSADVNGDGKIGLEEVIYILQRISGLRQ